MTTTAAISRLAYASVWELATTLKAPLAAQDTPLDFALVTPNGSVLGCVMRLLSNASIQPSTQFCYDQDIPELQCLSQSDFDSLRSNLISQLQSQAPDADMSNTINLWIGQQTRVPDADVQPLINEVIAALLDKGADPLATDADGNNTLFYLARSGDQAQLTKLLSGRSPWKPCGVATAIFHRNRAGQSAREFVEARPATHPIVDVRIVLDLLQQMETSWTRRIKPALIEALTQEFGMAKDAAVLCAQYIDGSSSGGAGGTKRKAGAIDDEEQKEGEMADAQ